MHTILDVPPRQGRWMWVVRARRPRRGHDLVPRGLARRRAARDRLHASTRPRCGRRVVNPACKYLLMAWAFEHGFGRVQLKTDIRNVRSQQAIARLGARYEGVLRRYQRRQDGSVRDTVVFSVTAEDWPAVRAVSRPPGLTLRGRSARRLRRQQPWRPGSARPPTVPPPWFVHAAWRVHRARTSTTHRRLRRVRLPRERQSRRSANHSTPTPVVSLGQSGERPRRRMAHADHYGRGRRGSARSRRSARR